MGCEGRGELGWDCSGPQSLRHQPRRQRGDQVDHGVLVGEGRRPAVSPGSTRLMPGWNPIFQADPRQKDEIENTRVAPISTKPVFLDFPIFLVTQISPLLGFDGMIGFHKRGAKNTGYAWLSPCYGLVHCYFYFCLLYILIGCIILFQVYFR